MVLTIRPEVPTSGFTGDQVFIENRGQWDEEVLFIARAGSVRILRTGMEFCIGGEGHEGGARLKYEFLNGSVASPRGIEHLPTRYNYYLGNDPSRWAEDAMSFREVLFEEVWESIDVRFHFSGSALKYDIMVRPGGDPDRICLGVHGAEQLKAAGDDLLFMEGSDVLGRDGGLLVYQDHLENMIDASYRIGPDNTFSFDIGNYDKDELLVIDPIVYGNYIGGYGWQEIMDSDLDAGSNHYLTGYTGAPDFPTTPDAYDNSSNGSEDIFLSKVSSDGSVLVYSTFIGGMAIDRGTKMVMDGSGSVYLTGYTGSMDFPTTPGAINTTNSGTNSDAFLVKMDPGTGKLLYSTFLGGSGMEEGNDICLASDGDILITGFTKSSDFPIHGDPYNTIDTKSWDIFVCRIESDLSDLVFSTFFGGFSNDVGKDIMVLDNGDIVISGETTSDDLEMILGGYDRSFAAEVDSFIYILDSDASALKATTYFGGNNLDHITGLDVDADGNIYVGGYSYSTDLPTTEDAYQEYWNDLYDIFVARFNPQLSRLQYCTYIGSHDMETANDLIIDDRGRLHMAGRTESTTFPVTWGALQNRNDGNSDCIYFIFDPSTSELVYSTYFGGSSDEYCNALELIDDRTVLLSGWTASGDLPFNDRGFNDHITGWQDGFSCAIDLSLPPEVPQNLSVVPELSGANITWDPPVEDGGKPVTGYLLGKIRLDDTPRLKLYELGPSKHFYFDEEIQVGYSYVYKIAARNIAGLGNFTDNATLEYFFPPTVPRDLKVELLDGILNISWNAPEFDGGSPIVNYSVEKVRVDDGMQWKFNTTSEYLLDENFTKGVAYRYSVRANNGYHISEDLAMTEFIHITKPSAPFGLEVRYGNRFANVSWEEPLDDGGIPIIAYHFYRGLGPTNLTIISTLVGENRSFNDTSVVNGVDYFYMVSATNGQGVSGTSEVVSAKPIGPPNPPWKVESNYSGGIVYLTWDPPTTDGGSPILEYRVYRWLEGLVPEVLMPVSGERTYYNDTSVEPNSEYYYFVTAVSELGESDPSDMIIVEITGHPTSPRSLKAVPGPGFVTLEWVPPSDTGHMPLTGYKLYKKIGDGGFEILVELTANEEFHVDTEIELGVVYTYRVAALNGIGESRPSAEVEFYPVAPPSPPGNLLAHSSEDMIELTWITPSEDGGVPLVNIHIFRGPDPGSLEHYGSVGGMATSFQDEDVEVGVEYYYKVAASNGIFNSTMSQIARGVPKGLPGAVVECTAFLVNGSIELKWSPPGNTGGTEILYYHIYRRNTSGAFELIAKVPGSQTTHSDSEILLPGIYVYYVVAENSIGRGPQSVKFDEEVPSSFFDEDEEGLGALVIIALVFLGLSLLIAIISVVVRIRRRSVGEEAVPVPVYEEGYQFPQEGYYPDGGEVYEQGYAEGYPEGYQQEYLREYQQESPIYEQQGVDPEPVDGYPQEYQQGVPEVEEEVPEGYRTEESVPAPEKPVIDQGVPIDEETFEDEGASVEESEA
ncbi:MAG: fibronectin type III domain-containing protein [Thermoplasmatota archaeon]